jgi:uncharacterized protein (TIGR03663 family)
MAQLVQERSRPRVVAPEAPVEERTAPETPRDWTWLIFLGITAVAFALRMWDLGSRAMHHDESLHALYSWYLYQGRPYVHDPMMHGPLLFHFTALLYLLFGDSEVTARLPMVLGGTGAVFLPYFLRHELGRYGAIGASLMLAFGPTFLYFSRFAHNEGMIIFQTLLVVVGLFGWVRERKASWLYAVAIGLALMFTTKVVVYLFGVILVAYIIGAIAVERLFPGRAPIITNAVLDVGWRRLGVMAGIFFGIGAVLYTTFFTNLEGLCTAILSPPIGSCQGKQGMLQYWHDQQGVARGSQPGFYYFLLLPLYEVVPLVLAFVAPFLAWRSNFRFFWFSAWWAFATILIYSYASEKMPWLIVHLSLPLVFVAAHAVEPLVRRLEAPWGLTPRQWAVAGLSLLLGTAFVAWATVGADAGATPLGIQTSQLRRIALALVVGGIAIGLVVVAGRLRWRQTLGAVAATGLLILMAYSMHTAWQATYKNGDVPVEMLVYVQSSPDAPFIANEVERLANQLGLRKDNQNLPTNQGLWEMPLLLDGGYTDIVNGVSVPHEAVSWPFEWYFRDYKSKQYYTRNLPPEWDTGKFPALIVMGTNLDPIRDKLDGYTGNKFRLNWWYPEDYKQMTWSTIPSTLFETLMDSERRAKLMKYILYRELINPPLGARELWFYVRNDLVGGVPAVAAPGAAQPGGAAPAVGAPSRPGQVASAPVAVRAAGTYGRPAAGGQPILREPKGVATGPDGNVYVTDSGTSTITVFSPEGAVLRTFGRKGAGDGELNEPWGLAVANDGSVFVADTWNHRVQKFDSQGRFLTKWGIAQAGSEPSQFYGPRDIAIARNGDILVADTGNKRIQVFDQQGTFRRAFGSEGTGSGQFREPVGIAVGREGRLYVADTWNQRIQIFDESYQSVGQLAVTGWTGQGVMNKPYLAVAPDGTVYATVPEARQVLRITDGIVGALSLPSDPRIQLPIGVEVAADGRVLVVDSQGSVVVAYGVGAPSEAAPGISDDVGRGPGDSAAPAGPN